MCQVETNLNEERWCAGRPTSALPGISEGLKGLVKERAFGPRLEAIWPEGRKENRCILPFLLSTVKVPDAATGGQVGPDPEGGSGAGKGFR